MTNFFNMTLKLDDLKIKKKKRHLAREQGVRISDPE